MRESTNETKLTQWIEKNIGGRVKSIAIQPRWRPHWYAEVEKDGKILPLYIKGDRLDFTVPCGADQEAKIMQILERHGVPVPHVYGVCEDPHAFIMDKVDGAGVLTAAKDEAERVSVLEHLAEIMVKMHSIDPKEFLAADLKMPTSAEEIAMSIFKPCEVLYRKDKTKPDPFIEFAVKWLKRNVPHKTGAPSLQQCDAGQFLFENGKITAIHDFEYGVLGDPHLDLAAMPARGLYARMGDLRPLFRRYQELTKVQLNHHDFCYQEAMWYTAMAMQPIRAIENPPADGNYPEYMSWWFISVHTAYQAMAEIMGITIDFPELTSPEPSRWGHAMRLLEARVPRSEARLTPEGLKGSTKEEYDHLVNYELAVLAHSLDVYRNELEAEYIAEVEDILGHKVKGWADADRQIEDFVINNAGPEHDERLLRMFHRWLHRNFQMVKWLGTKNPLLHRPMQSGRELGFR